MRFMLVGIEHATALPQTPPMPNSQPRSGDINAAWFQEVAAYESGVGTYASQHLNGNPQVHYDRASVMIDGRDLEQSIFNVGPQTASSTLWNFWMNN